MAENHLWCLKQPVEFESLAQIVVNEEKWGSLKWQICWTIIIIEAGILYASNEKRRNKKKKNNKRIHKWANGREKVLKKKNYSSE